MKNQKCCGHCPGKLLPPGSNELHECCQPRYVSGNLKISSLKKLVSDDPVRKEVKEDVPLPLPENRSLCYDRFAIAKKLHAENLEHQPLPDRVDDSIFKNVRSQGCCCGSCKHCERTDEDCLKKLSRRYEPVLGYKEPKTKMDLAICWETPVDPVYEPHKPAHIDGSEGGLAPAIFSLVQHTSTSRASLHSGSARKEEPPTSGRGRYRSQEDGNHSGNENKVVDSKDGKCCCECLCKDLDKVKISKKIQVGGGPRNVSFRKCVACEAKNIKEDPRLIRSAVGLALGMEKSENNPRKTGIKSTIPRPRTPFARRNFCIDSLSPPFSVVNGYRDADFPEHWRLMSVYQQSYRNPYRRRNYRC
ncbi:hypothetical protein WH47_03620 [Habropoda laboriosa]|uniref:DUF4812 domain-containing protein n=1 Tax=Habropoda laboriosa TaxID=597456 RepID=A0A0L7RIE7_9HYME|nr:PREDICTED: uncharacterized protein LOC108573990 [Habropoda laboriosa]KOC70604.1 hypothetical protein WH47_03620 [Habropoda laboriosa]